MINKYPTTFRLLFMVFLFAFAILSPDFLFKIVPIPFMGVILLVLATWVLYKLDKKDLKALGLTFQIKTIAFLFAGTLLGIISHALSTYSRTLYTGEKWHLNPELDWSYLLSAVWGVLASAITQQLLFRGYGFTKTLEKSNLLIANIIWGSLFVLYHNIWGSNPYDIPLMILSLFMAHYVFSSALLKSATLYFPIGIHFGHNWSSQYLNAYKPGDYGIFDLTNQRVLSTFPTVIIFPLTYNLGFIILMFILWRWKSHKHPYWFKSSAQRS